MTILAVGTDCQSIDDVELSLRSMGFQYVRRLFDHDEEEYVRAHPHTAARFLAGRFAAREAVLKLLQTDDAIHHWHDVTIRSSLSRLHVSLRNGSMIRARHRGIASIHLCIDSAGGIAIAVAVADIGASFGGDDVISIVTKVRQVIATHGNLMKDVAELSDSDDLYECGMSSHATVNVMLALENEFDIEFPDVELRRSSFQSVDSICRVLTSLGVSKDS